VTVNLPSTTRFVDVTRKQKRGIRSDPALFRLSYVVLELLLDLYVEVALEGGGMGGIKTDGGIGVRERRPSIKDVVDTEG
jgi:hypothetical protein